MFAGRAAVVRNETRASKWNSRLMIHTMTRRLCHRRLTLAIVALCMLPIAACASTSINRILADPAKYRDKDVRVSGSVVDSYSVTDRGAYKLDDKSGQIWVLSDRGVPRRGARVTVTGRVREGFNLGTLGDQIRLPQAIGSPLVLVESSRDAKD
jgi:hypothetical protein